MDSKPTDGVAAASASASSPETPPQKPLFFTGGVAKAGDTAILFKSHADVFAVVLEPGKVLHHKFGDFKHDDMIGLQWGNKVESSTTPGHLWMTALTPEYWTNALAHRTQIIYSTDISQILHFLEVIPGSIVVESGTGSGSLTTSFIRAVAPSGHVHTFEYNTSRATEARRDFARLGLDKLVTVRQADVYKDGFLELADSAADAVFLDLPQPWLAVAHAYRVLKPGGRICSFSPCVEQVDRTCRVMRALGFDETYTVEVLTKDLVVNMDVYGPPVLDASYIASGASDSKLQLEGWLRKKRKRILHGLGKTSTGANAAGSRDSRGGTGGGAGGDTHGSQGKGKGRGRGRGSQKRPRDDDMGDDGGEGTVEDDDEEDIALALGHNDFPSVGEPPRPSADAGAGAGAEAAADPSAERNYNRLVAPVSLSEAEVARIKSREPRVKYTFQLAREGGVTIDEAAEESAAIEARLLRLVPPRLPPLSEHAPYVRQSIPMKGHTSYLTFSTLWHKAHKDGASVVADLLKTFPTA